MTRTSPSSGAYSELVSGITQKAESTQQIQEEQFSEARGGAIKPPFDPVNMAKLIEVNTTHAKAVFSKGRNVAGFGLEIVPHPDVENPSESEKRIAEDFWFSGDSTWQVGPVSSERATPADVLEMAWIDYEAIGWLSIETLTSLDGTPVGLAYIPAMTIRKRREDPGFVQVKDTKTRYFGVHGDRYDNPKQFVDEETGDVDTSVDNPANEIIFKRNHSPLYEHYGAPDIVPAIKTLEGDEEARDFNVDFFEHNAVPRLAIIVEGGELTEGAREDIRKIIHDMKDGDHRTMVLEVEKLLEEQVQLDENDDVKIRVEPLTVGLEEDASFREYRQDNQDDILKVHDVPPVEAGDIKSGAFSTDAEQQRRGYIETVIQPKQEAFAELLYETVHAALGITDYTLQFHTRGVDTRLQDAEIARTRVQASQGAVTLNEVREWLGLEPLERPAGEMLLLEASAPAAPTGGPGQAIEESLDGMVDDMRNELMAELRTEARVTAPADD